MHRIKEYDGEDVVFSCPDKSSGEDEEKEERVTEEEFITRLIRHIPDEHFKTIRYYGIYSRRTKIASKKLLHVWQEQSRKWVVRVQRVLKRRFWRERVKQTTGKDPLVCPRCECYYEYKGEVCLQEGKLRGKYARCRMTQACLERMAISPV
uniref:transposase n=1 Tax=Paenibacillus cymbidii TaxID=1639034 RepID=UPI001081436D|nr:transposase [Paenibacillus cymbidii]